MVQESSSRCISRKAQRLAGHGVCHLRRQRFLLGPEAWRGYLWANVHQDPDRRGERLRGVQRRQARQLLRRREQRDRDADGAAREVAGRQQGTEPIALSLREKGCVLLITPPGLVFITSDDPALVYVGAQPAMLEVKPGFIERPDVEVFMALKPDMACLWSASSCGRPRVITAEEVARRNQDL
jgi:hypothetical protein